MRWWPQRLRPQLVLTVSLLLCLALALLGGYTAHQQVNMGRQSHEAQAAAFARNMAISSVNLILKDDLDGVEELSLRAADFAEVRNLQLLTPNGNALNHVAKRPGQPPQVVIDSPDEVWTVPEELKPSVSFDPTTAMVVAWHPVQSARTLGWVRVDYDASSLWALRGAIWRNTLVVAALSVLLCGGLLVLISRGPAKALDRARGFAVELLDGQGRQLTIEQGPLEVTELGRALNEASLLLAKQLGLVEEGLHSLRIGKAQLAAQNDQLNAIFSMSLDGLVTFNRTGYVQFVNEAFLTLTGLKAQQVVGHSEAAVDALLHEIALPSSTYQGLQACFIVANDDEVLQSPQTLLVQRHGLTVLTLSGQCRAEGAVAKALYVCNTTQQYKLNQIKSEFLAMAAHELRTPMASIFGFTELLMAREFSAEHRQDLLGRIYRQSQVMMSIIDELLDLARLEARSKQDFVLETVDLGDVVKQSLGDFKTPQGRADPALGPTLAPMPVHVDPGKLKQALVNVLSNAYKYSPQGGAVSVRCLSGQSVVGRATFGIEVRDQGLGLSPEHLARMGERFFRADQSGSIPGTGLGVSIVKELMSLMGGRFQVESILGQGTTVTLWLPASSQ